ncbi:MAG: ACT domain-containing protein [Bdellovibrionales bacterium]|jgi:ACT domain-containing protein
MKIVVTIIGQDRVGIVAKVSTAMADVNVNVLDINQNIMNGFFNMVMIADMGAAKISLKELQQKLGEVGKEIGVEIKVQSQDIFNVMHRI